MKMSIDTTVYYMYNLFWLNNKYLKQITGLVTSKKLVA